MGFYKLLAAVWLFIFPQLLLAQAPEIIKNSTNSQDENIVSLSGIKHNLTLGILSYRPKHTVEKKWQPLIDYINKSSSNLDLKLVTLNYQDLQQAIDSKSIDFLLTNSANYIQLNHQHSLSAPLVSLINRSDNGKAQPSFGGVIVTLKSSQINSLQDLKHKRIASPAKAAFGGFKMQAYELHKAGFNLKKDFITIETGMPHDTAINSLLNNQADAAFVRTGILEALKKEAPEKFTQLKVINQPFESHPFLLSTRLYPEWPFSALEHTNKIVAGQVAGLLLSLPHQSDLTDSMGIYGFSIPADYEPIREVLRSLRHYPYNYTPELSYEEVWLLYKYEISALSLVTLTILLLAIGLKSANLKLKEQHHILEGQTTSLAIAAVAFDTQQAILISTPDEKIVRVNNAFSEITGYQPEDVIGQTPRMFKSNFHDKSFYQSIWHNLQQYGFWQGEIWNRRKSGEVYPVGQSIKSIKNSKGETTHYLSTFTDITLHKENERKIRELAFFDPLTNLANRRLFKDHLNQTMIASEHDGYYYAIIFIDLDNFKTLNDTLGHHYGDLLLKKLANRVNSCVEEGDTVSRPGGDEFILLLPNVSTSYQTTYIKTQKVAEKILAEISKPYDLSGTPYDISVSLGITVCKGRNKSIEELMKHSDLAMYQSKQSGKNTISFFDPEMQKAIDKRSRLEKDLRIAIEQQQFALFYQPKFDVNDQLIGYEALIRWHHPENGLVPPNEFIPVAEETGLINEIGAWVIEQACHQLNSWAKIPEKAQLSIAVNVSERQLEQANFVKQTTEVVNHCCMVPERLQIEITESQLMENVEQSVQKIHALRKLGISFALDDFGTGYSSLVYLKALPISTLKIDQSFIKEISDNDESRAIILTIISLAKTLGLQLVAEGVETEQQKQFLIDSGCDYLQGYLLGRPQPIDENSES